MALIDFLSSLKSFPYHPITSWEIFSPHVTFGANAKDRDVETHVLDAVGSYGSQINRIMDAMSVLVSHLEPNELTPHENFKISKFNELADLADKVATDYQEKPLSQGVTEADVDRLLDAIEDLKQSHDGAYKYLTSMILERLWRSSQKQ